jgi:hypothetical protein
MTQRHQPRKGGHPQPYHHARIEHDFTARTLVRADGHTLELGAVLHHEHGRFGFESRCFGGGRTSTLGGLGRKQTPSLWSRVSVSTHVVPQQCGMWHPHRAQKTSDKVTSEANHTHPHPTAPEARGAVASFAFPPPHDKKTQASPTHQLRSPTIVRTYKHNGRGCLCAHLTLATGQRRVARGG